MSDVLLTALAFEAAYQTRLLFPLERVFYIVVPAKALLLGFAAGMWLLLGIWLGVYDRLDSAHPRVILRDSIRQCGLGGICMVLFEYALRMDLSRVFMGLFVLYSWLLLVLFRWKAGKLIGIIRTEFSAPRYLLVAGLGGRARRIGEALEQSERYGIRLLGFLAEPGLEAPPRSVALRREYPVYPIEQLPDLLRNEVIDEILFAVDSHLLAGLEEVFLLCDEEGVRTRVAADFFPHVNSDVYLERLGELPLLTFSAAPHDEIRLLAKRIVDVIVASAALAAVSPLMLLVAALVRFTSPGPVIFRQVRCGLNGRRFVFYKFRSMVDNADEMKPALAHLNRKTTAFKIPNDPRLTPVGRWLRKYSIDEWPQLWNVLRGDMSLVGPRPAVPDEVDRYQRWQRRRLRMRPGLTCLWAVSGRDALDFDTWMRMDMQYIDNWSLTLDWKILLRTIPHVLSGKGAY